MEAIRKSAMEVSADELLAESKEIQDSFRALRFAQKMRFMSMACFKECGGTIKYPFRIDQDAIFSLKGHDCFGDCMNANLERGPFLKDLGDIPEGAIPKKFLWPHGI